MGGGGETLLSQCQGQSVVPPNWHPLLPEGPEASRAEETGLSKERRNPHISLPQPLPGPLGKTDTGACHILLGPDLLGRNLRKPALAWEETYLEPAAESLFAEGCLDMPQQAQPRACSSCRHTQSAPKQGKGNPPPDVWVCGCEGVWVGVS